MDPAFPDDVISHLLLRLFRSGGLWEVHDHGGLQVSLSEVFALRELAAEHDLSQTDLALRMGLEKSTVSRLVAGLEERGWLVRARDQANRRYVRLSLSEAGQDAAARIGEHFRENHRRILAGLAPGEVEALLVGLGALARVIADQHAGHAEHAEQHAGHSGQHADHG